MLNTFRMQLNRWATWSERTTNRRIFAAMLSVGMLTGIVNLMGSAKELVVAYHFGTSDALDAFLIAFLLPSFAISVVAGSFDPALIPTYIEVRERNGKAAAQQLFSNVMTWGLGLLVTVSCFLGLAAYFILPILGSSFNSEKIALTRSLFFVLLPVLVISGFTKIGSAVLNAGECFVLPAIVPIITPTIIVVTLFLFTKTSGIYVLAIGVLVGILLEVVVLGMGLVRIGIFPVLRWQGITPDLKRVMQQYMPMIAGSLLMSSTGLVDQAMAAMIGPGSVAALSYGNKVVSFLLGISAMAIGTAVLPHFSKMVALSDYKGVRNTMKIYTKLILVVSIPLTLLFVYFSESLVRIIFERGAFTEADTHIVGQVQAFYILQIPFYLIGILIVRLISSMKANKILMWGAIINLVVNVILNYIFMQWIGVAGIALSTTVTYCISAIFLSYMLWRLSRTVYGSG